MKPTEFRIALPDENPAGQGATRPLLAELNLPQGIRA